MNEELIRQAVADTVHCENYPSDGGFRTGQEDAAEAIRLYHARYVAPLEQENAELRALVKDLTAQAKADGERIGRLEANVAPLVEAAEALVNMIEHSMTGMVHPEKGRFIKGVTDLDITPDGSVKLSHAREALAPFQKENSND